MAVIQHKNIPDSELHEVKGVVNAPFGQVCVATGNGTSSFAYLNYALLTGTPTLGSAASHSDTDFATAAQGSKADTAVQNVNGHTGTSVTVSKGDVGLGNVDNTSDVNKPVSTAQQTALNLKLNSAGVTNGSNASSGQIGEYLSVTGSSTALTSGAAKTVATLSLTPGDWDVQATIQYTPAGTTTISTASSSVSLVTDTNGALGTVNAVVVGGSPSAGAGQTLTSPTVRVNVSATTNVFAVASSFFSVSTCNATAYIRARRVR